MHVIAHNAKRVQIVNPTVTIMHAFCNQFCDILSGKPFWSVVRLV